MLLASRPAVLQTHTPAINVLVTEQDPETVAMAAHRVAPEQSVSAVARYRTRATGALT
jgi:hypothetical protein